MSIKPLLLLVISISLFSCATDEPEVELVSERKQSLYQHDWHGVIDPTENKSQVYGGYTAGCVDGAKRLPDLGVGYKAVNLLNNRMYGHPTLIKVIEELGRSMHLNHKRVVLVGDLGHARGGPASIETSAHRSHQTGLDVDIWFRNLELGEGAKDAIYPHSVLAKSRKKLSRKHWDESHMAMLKLVSSYGEVERVLVNPYVKKAMCRKFSGASWLNKLRPWWGHDKHFHVRLKCPEGSSACKKQGAVPKDSGCGEALDWWFSKDANKAGKEKKAKKRVYPKLPKQCESVWEWEE